MMDEKLAIRILSAPNVRTELIKQLDTVFGGRNGWCYVDNGLFVMNSGTVGWGNAIYKTCAQCGHYNLWEWYAALPWDDSDRFDAVIEDILLGIAPFVVDDMV